MSGPYHTLTRKFGGYLSDVKTWYDPGHDSRSGPPAPPNQNDALNSAQAESDALRARRGVLANMFAGAQTGGSSTPVVGKTQLGQ